MIRATPDDAVRPPANVVAQLVLQCTRDDPTLVKRSRGHTRTEQTQAIQSPVTRPPVTRAEPRPPPILLSDADPATKQYFEDLVSIAVASSERADDLLREAHEASRKATHATWAFASIAAVSVVVGVAGMIGSHHGNAADTRLTEIAGGVKSLGQQQQQASQQLAAVRSEITDERPATVAVQQTADAPPANTQGATPVEAVPVEAIPVQTVPAGTVPVEAVPVQTVPVRTVPLETLPVQTVPVRTVPVETLPVQTVPVQTVPVETLPQPTQPFGATPASPVQQATYSPPWPVYHHPRQPTRIVQRRRIPVPRFLVLFQQNLRTLFR
jgi:hypothetical protein